MVDQAAVVRDDSVLTLASVLVLMAAVSWVYCLGLLLKTGSSVPTATQTQTLNQYGTIVYVTPVEERWLGRLRMLLVLGIALIAIGGSPQLPTLSDSTVLPKRRLLTLLVRALALRAASSTSLSGPMCYSRL
jgi:hypothetical protein